MLSVTIKTRLKETSIRDPQVEFSYGSHLLSLKLNELHKILIFYHNFCCYVAILATPQFLWLHCWPACATHAVTQIDACRVYPTYISVANSGAKITIHENNFELPQIPAKPFK